MLTRDSELDRQRLELPASNDVRYAREPALEELAQLRLGRERRVMVELDVRDDCDLGLEQADRAIRLVAFDDEPAGASARIAAELGNDAADDPRGVLSQLAQDIRDHRGGRRLSVSACDDDRAPTRHQVGEELGAARASGASSRPVRAGW